MITISVIVGSTRQGRFSEKPARWILQHLQKRDGIEARLLDLRAAAFVSHGSAMGARAVQQLRQVMTEIQVSPVRSTVHIPVATFGHIINAAMWTKDSPSL